MNQTEVVPNNELRVPLKAKITLELHCAQAQLLFHGKWQHGQRGLTQFAKLMSILWHAAKEGDPYAEWYLLKTHDEIYSVKEGFKAIEAYLDGRLQQLRGIEIKIYSNEEPLKKELFMVTPFGFLGAQLLVDFDYIIRKALTLKKLGIHLKPERYDNPSMLRALRKLFSFPSRWHRTSITREDVLANNEKAQKAVMLMGELPDAILHHKLDFPFKPV